MFTKTLLAAATAGLIAAGALTATPGTANATGYSFQFGNSGVQFGFHGPRRHFGYETPRRNYGYRPYKRRVCKPVFRKVRWIDRWGRAHWQRVQVGERCERRQPRRWQRPNQGGFYFHFGN